MLLSLDLFFQHGSAHPFKTSAASIYTYSTDNEQMFENPEVSNVGNELFFSMAADAKSAIEFTATRYENMFLLSD